MNMEILLKTRRSQGVRERSSRVAPAPPGSLRVNPLLLHLEGQVVEVPGDDLLLVVGGEACPVEILPAGPFYPIRHGLEDPLGLASNFDHQIISIWRSQADLQFDAEPDPGVGRKMPSVVLGSPIIRRSGFVARGQW